MDDSKFPRNDGNKAETHQNTANLAETNGSVKIAALKLPSLVDEDLRKACFDYIENFYCYGSSFIRDMVLTDIQNDYAFHYKLESFGEKRVCTERTTSYYGQRIDGPHNGKPPELWEVDIKPPPLFTDHQETTDIPHSAHVKHCTTCKWNMKVRCDKCSLKGVENCLLCFGSGKEDDNKKCIACKGSGKEMCEKCHGKGVVECGACDGHGELVHYKVLVATWKTHSDDFISNTFNFPKALILEADGEEIYKEVEEQVQPIHLEQEKEINEASTALIDKHMSFQNEEIIAQRHYLLAVPLTKAKYTWRNKEGEFYVYGAQNKVYFEDYPATCGNCICC